MKKSLKSLDRRIREGLVGPFESDSFYLGYNSFVKGDIKIGYDVRIENGTYIISKNGRIILADKVRIGDHASIGYRGGDIKIGEGVTIGNAALLGGNISIGERSELEDRVTILQNTYIGKRNKFNNCTIGSAPQGCRDGGNGKVIIGDDNDIRENVVVNRGSLVGGGKTIIGNGNKIFSHIHIAHDCIIGNNNELITSVGLAGHVVVGDYVRVSGQVGVAQWVHIGDGAFIGGQSGIDGNVLPYSRVGGSPAFLKGINFVRLKRLYGEKWREVRRELKDIYEFMGNEKLDVDDLIYLFNHSINESARKIAKFLENLNPNNKDLLRFMKAYDKDKKSKKSEGRR